MIKSKEIAALLTRRIESGDYTLQGVPGERSLAEETGVCRMTARRAVLELIERGLLIRTPNGRLAVNRAGPGKTGRIQVAYLTPTFASQHEEKMRAMLGRLANQFQVILRPIDYVHWDDPIVIETLQSFDGAFITATPESIPKRVLDRIQTGRCRCVSLTRELDSCGIPSVDLLPATHVSTLLTHLEQLGHRSIDCFNVHPAEKRIVIERVEQWNQWIHARGLQGKLHDKPLPPFEETLNRVYAKFKSIYDRRDFKATALFCTTMSAAIAAIRVFYEAGLTLGHDVSVCTIDDLGMARCLVPSVTSLDEPDPLPLVSIAMEWIVSGKPWTGPLLLAAKDPPMFIGGSTGPPKRRRRLMSAKS